MRDTQSTLQKAARGTVSLFVVVVLTPFLTTAVLMLEAQKYNTAVSILDEAMGVSATSVLGEYDSYLLKRWGLTAVSQDTAIDESFTDVLSVNAGVLGSTINIQRASAAGKSEFALGAADLQVLESQIKEFSKQNAPFTLGKEYANISKIFSLLEDFKHLDLMSGLLGGALDIFDNVIDLVRKIKKLHDSGKDINKKIDEYNSGYDAFKSASDTYLNSLDDLDRLNAERSDLQSRQAQQLREYESSQQEAQRQRQRVDERARELNELSDRLQAEPVAEGEEAQPVEENEEYRQLRTQYDAEVNAYNTLASQGNAEREAYNQTTRELAAKNAEVTSKEGEVSSNATALENARTAYLQNISSLESAITTYKEDVDACASAVGKVGSGAQSLKSKGLSFSLALGKDDIDGERISKGKKDEAKVELSTVDALNKAADKGQKAVTQGFSDSGITSDNDALGQKVAELQALCEHVGEYTLDVARTQRKRVTDSEYKKPQSRMDMRLQKIKEFALDIPKKLFGTGIISFMKGIKTFIESAVTIKGPVDTALGAVVDDAYFTAGIGASPPVGMLAGGWIDDPFSGFFSSVDGVGDFPTSIAAVIGFVQSIASVLKAIIAVFDVVATFIKSIVDIFLDGKLLYATYAAYMTSCRTDNTSNGISFTTMSGYNVKSTELPSTSILESAENFIYALLNIQKDPNAGMTSSDGFKTFCGAELEYLIYGSSNEISNQINVLMPLFLLRLALDAVSMLTNPQAQELAAATVLAYPLTMAILILAEGVVDLMLLVNGQTVPIVKLQALGTNCYMTPSGLPELCEKFFGLLKLTSAEKSEMAAGITNSIDALNPEDKKMSHETRKAIFDKGETAKTPDGFSGGVTKWFRSLVDFNYRDYCYLMLLFLVDGQTIINRLANLIQMETRYYYDKNKAGYDFNIRNAYTYLETSVDASIVQMMPTLTESSLYNIHRVQYRGY